MVTIVSLWLPILLSAVLVFIASSLMHMFLTYHKSDFEKLPDEEKIMTALGEFDIPEGEYYFPYPSTNKERQSPEFIAKLEKGPVAFITVLPNGNPGMGKSLVQWFIYCAVIGVFVAYICGRIFGPGADYLEVFRFAGTTAFIAYVVALWQSSIWFKRKWSTTLKHTFDGFVYALLTAGVFGWLWP